MMKPGRKSDTVLKSEVGTSRKAKIASLFGAGLANADVWRAMESAYPQTIKDDNERQKVCVEKGITVPGFDPVERDNLGKAIRQVKGLMGKDNEAIDGIVEAAGTGDAKSADEIELTNQSRFQCGLPSLDFIYGKTAFQWTEDAPNSQYELTDYVDRKGVARQRKTWVSGSYQAGQYMPSDSKGNPNWKPQNSQFWYTDDEKQAYVEHGMPDGGLSLWGGAPGVGKTRLALAVTRALTNLGQDVLYFNGEATENDLRKWLGTDFEPDLLKIISGEHIRLGAAVEQIYKYKPRVVIVDSFQMIAEVAFNGGRGAVSTLSAMKTVKSDDEAGYPHIINISQLNKQDELAGSRHIEHMVDFAALITKIEGRRKQFMFDVPRKNRYGATGIGLPFMHTDRGVICSATDGSFRLEPVYKLLQSNSNPIIEGGVQEPA